MFCNFQTPTPMNYIRRELTLTASCPNVVELLQSRETIKTESPSQRRQSTGEVWPGAISLREHSINSFLLLKIIYLISTSLFGPEMQPVITFGSKTDPITLNILLNRLKNFKKNFLIFLSFLYSEIMRATPTICFNFMGKKMIIC